MQSAAIPLRWFGAGCLFAILLMAAGAYSMGSWAALLRVGTVNPAFERLDRQLGPLPASDPIGHDGQLFYLIARDPFVASDTPAVIGAFDANGARYRYRRILFPLLAGGFGQFAGRETLIAMIALLVIASGLTAVALADLGRQLRVPTESVLIALLNPGSLVALVMLLGDVVALACALGAVALLLRQRFAWSMLLCALAALTKETYLIVPAAAAGWLWYRGDRRLALAFAVVPALPILAWSGWIASAVPPDGAAARNLGFPLRGLLEAAAIWVMSERKAGEIALGALASIILVRAALAALRRPGHVLSWMVAPWILLGCFASVDVWGKPNNAARALAILWPLTVLLLTSKSGVGDSSPDVSTRPAVREVC